MNKTGIVMKVENKKACILTEDGQFLNVIVRGKAPGIGEVYTGKAVRVFPLKRAAAAAAVFLLILSGSLTHTYNAEAASIVFNGNSKIRLSVNRWNRIIKAEALNEDGKKVLDSVNIKNQSLNAGLDTIVSEEKKENLTAADNNSDTQGDINVFVEKNKKGNSTPDLDEFRNRMKEENINVVVEVEKEKGNDNAAGNDKNKGTEENQTAKPNINGHDSGNSRKATAPGLDVKKNNGGNSSSDDNSGNSYNEDNKGDNSDSKRVDNNKKSNGNGENKKEGRGKEKH